MVADYTTGDAIWTIVLFVLWMAFIGVGIWLLIRLFRNTNFLRNHRGLRIVVKVLLVVFTVFLPLLGLPLLLGVWFLTRSPSAEPLDADDAKTGASADGPTAYERRLPFPAPSAPEDGHS